MTCKDCIYEPNCYSRIANGMGDDKIRGGLLTDIDKRCKGFKNKADAFPVVRCKDCKHYKKINYDDVNPNTCEITTRRQHPYDFCSYAERK